MAADSQATGFLKKVFRKVKKQFAAKQTPAGANEYRVFQKGLVHHTAKFTTPENIELGEGSEIKDYVILQASGRIKIGKLCQLNPFTLIYASSEVIIGDYVMIAPHCMIASGVHNHRQMEKPMRLAGCFTKGPIVIEDDVWIGANCTITDGVKIGKGAVVAANSCVVKDVEPYTIVSGVPAKMISSRIK